MSLKVRKRAGGKRLYWAFGTLAGQSFRRPLGTANHDTASNLATYIENAIGGGQNSPLWPHLKRVLPPRTFSAVANMANYHEPEPINIPIWRDLKAAFEAEMEQRIAIGKLAESTRERYVQTLKAFDTFANTAGIAELRAMNRAFLEKFKAWRLAKIKERKFSRNGRGLALDVAILHRVFSFAVENEMAEKNPVRLEGRPGDDPESGAQPLTAEQLSKVREVANDDLLVFLLLRWTGLRGSDAVKLTWGEIDWEGREINRLTQKRRKRVVLPIPQELFFALEVERDRRAPRPWEHVLVNPRTGKAMTRPRLYQRVQAMGRRANLSDIHPHRFRDTFAVDMLARGASPYDVAKLLGDTVGTMEKHYAPFVKELRDRVRDLMENGEGLAKTHSTFFAQSEKGQKQIQ